MDGDVGLLRRQRERAHSGLLRMDSDRVGPSHYWCGHRETRREGRIQWRVWGLQHPLVPYSKYLISFSRQIFIIDLTDKKVGVIVVSNVSNSLSIEFKH